MALSQSIFTTPDEYLQMDRYSPVRHEYIDGNAYALAGGSLNHSAVCMNLGSYLHRLLRGSSCRVYNSDARVHLSPTRYVYPDLTISCEPQDQGETDLLTAPRVVIETLSPGTEAYDRGDKFAYYRECPTVQGYVLVASEHRAVEVFRRPQPQENISSWRGQTYTAGDLILLVSVNAEIPFDEIYAETTVPA